MCSPPKAGLDESSSPYEVPEKKAKKKATGTRRGLRRKVTSGSSSYDSDVPSSHENEEEGKTPPLDYSTNADNGEEEWPHRAKPLEKS